MRDSIDEDEHLVTVSQMRSPTTRSQWGRVDSRTGILPVDCGTGILPVFRKWHRIYEAMLSHGYSKE